MDIRLAQLAVGRDLDANLARILEVIDGALPGELVVFPEGMLSGYDPSDDGYSGALDAGAIDRALARVRDRASRQGCRVLLGSALRDEGGWRNAVLLLDGPGGPRRYAKAELSALDRRHFTPGPTAGERFDIGGVPVGVLACRELLFPAAWMDLKARGAKVVFHLNNAVQPHDGLWRHVVIARAVELSVFVCSVNNAAPSQVLPSLLVSPSGRVILETTPAKDEVLRARIDPGEAIVDLSRRTDY